MGQSPPSSTYNQNKDGLPFYQGKSEFGPIYPTPQQYCSEPNKIALPGDTLISVRAPVGPTNLCPHKACIGRGLAAIRPIQEAPSKYILYLLRNLEPVIAKQGTGSTFKAITKDFLTHLEVQVPPLVEQYRIVDRIEELFSELDDGIASLKAAQQKLKVYRQAVLKWAFEGKLTAEWREERRRLGKLESAESLLAQIKQERERRYQQALDEWRDAIALWEANGKEGKKPRKPIKLKEFSSLDPKKIDDLPDIPEKWLYLRAENISDFITKGTTPQKEELFANSGDIPFIKVYNLTNSGLLDFTITPTYVSYSTHHGFLNRSIVYPGDILMNIVGPPLGKVSLVPDLYQEWNINQAIARYRTFECCSNNYFTYYLLSQLTIERMASKSKATAGQFNLTLEICRDLEVPICTVDEQHKIVDEIESRFSICDRLEADIQTNLEKAEALRQSILKQAFEGKLVPQDPNDEPASVLLERIKAEKEKLAAKTKKAQPKRKTKAQ